MKINKNTGFPQGMELGGEYNLFGPRNAAVIQNPLIKEDFDNNVETHESTCDTWPAG
ncbi:MAG: hypothetical protein ABSF85_09805 [Terriglobales bacterium]|jgi:hypothetical protein